MVDFVLFFVLFNYCKLDNGSMFFRFFKLVVLWVFVISEDSEVSEELNILLFFGILIFVFFFFYIYKI